MASETDDPDDHEEPNADVKSDASTDTDTSSSDKSDSDKDSTLPNQYQIEASIGGSSSAAEDEVDG